MLVQSKEDNMLEHGGRIKEASDKQKAQVQKELIKAKKSVRDKDKDISKLKQEI
jgi:hypothetical protein